MKRTLISLEADEKVWLDATAAREGKPAAELVRRALKLLKAQTPPSAQTFKDLLNRTRGLWRQGDGLAYQDRLRNEW